jgi:hypothetical protein
VYAQNEFVMVNDFETDAGDWRRTSEGVISGWVLDSRLTTPGEPHYSGEKALRVDALNAGGYTSSYYQFPVPFNAADMDEFRMWVYADDVFRIRAELGPGLIIGFAHYSAEDVGRWKELVFWISEEQAKLWQSQLLPVDEMRMIINPAQATVNGVIYPNGFDGILYIDDMRTRKRTPVVREYHTLIGFNDILDEFYYVTLAGGGTYFEVLLTDDPQPTEGEGILMFDYTSAWSQNLRINLKDFPEILEYDRIHMDIFVDGSSWATTALIMMTSQWLDEEGNPHGTSWTQLSETNLGAAVGGGWGEISAHYGPLNSVGNVFTDDDGTILDSLIPEIAGVYDDPNATIRLTITSQGAAANNMALAYIDNIRVSRPSATFVRDWELW